MKTREDVERYKGQSIHYLENAFLSIEAGEVEKASEFLWGSMAQAIKAAAAVKGLDLRSHRDIWDYARELAKDLGEPGIFDAFREANSLHSNFYEAGLTVDMVHASAEEIRAAVTKLLSLVG